MSYFSIPRDGLVREYHLDGSAADTNDGTKVPGTRTNVIDSFDSIGYNKQSASFNGSSSKITISNPLGASQTAFSFSVRIKPGSSSGTQYVIGPASSGLYFAYNVGSSGKLEGRINTGGPYILICQATLKVGEWHEYSYEWSTAQGNAKMYEDGVLISTSSDSRATSVNVSQALTLGAYDGGPGSYNGLMQDVRFFNRISTEDERRVRRNEFNRKLGGGGDFGVVIPAPTAFFDFRGDGVNVATSEYNASTAVTYGNPDHLGLDRAAGFNGSAYIDLTYAANPITSGAYAVFSVFKTPASAPANFGAIYTHCNSSNNAQLNFGLRSTMKLEIGIWNGSSIPAILTASALSASTWYAAVAVANGASSALYVAPIGGAVATATGTLNTVTPGFDRCCIGRDRYGNAYYFTGDIACVGTINQALTADQAKFLLAELSGDTPYAFRRSILQACGVHAYYDGTFSGSNAYDVAGGFGTKTIGGTMPSSVRAQQNKAYATNGGQNINLSGANLYDATGWWIAQWIKTTNSADTRNECNSNANGYWVGLQYNRGAAGKPEAFFYDGSNKYAIGTTTVNDGRWHLCIAEFVPGTHTRIWVDGRLETTTAVGTFSSNGNTQAQYAFADRDNGSRVNGKADWMYGKGPMTSQKAQMLYFGTYRQ